MIIVDTALAKRQAENNPVRVAMVGAGFMGRGIALQICNYVPGMQLVAIANRTVEKAKQAYTEAGIIDIQTVDTVS
jgi:predicted homoserine dehydrogenase-like protein